MTTATRINDTIIQLIAIREYIDDVVIIDYAIQILTATLTCYGG